MYVVKVRRMGNSDVIALPKELEASGYVAGASVLIERMPDGQLRMGRSTSLSAEQWQRLAEQVAAEDREALDKLAAKDRGGRSDEEMNAIVRRVVTENREALKLLAAYDRGESVPEGDVRTDSGRHPAT